MWHLRLLHFVLSAAKHAARRFVTCEIGPQPKLELTPFLPYKQVAPLNIKSNPDEQCACVNERLEPRR